MNNEINSEKLAAMNLIDVVESTMLGDLMELLIQEIKILPKSWAELGESQQNEVIYRAELTCRTAIQKATQIIAGRNHQTITATVESVTFKDGAKAVLKGFGHSFHDIADSCGQPVMVIIPEKEPSLEAPHGVNADKDQLDLLSSTGTA